MGHLLDENQKKSNMSYMFLFLPSTLDRKEEIMQFKNNVDLHPLDVAYKDLKEVNVNSDFNPSDLNNKTLRQKKIHEVSSRNFKQ